MLSSHLLTCRCFKFFEQIGLVCLGDGALTGSLGVLPYIQISLVSVHLYPFNLPGRTGDKAQSRFSFSKSMRGLTCPENSLNA